LRGADSFVRHCVSAQRLYDHRVNESAPRHRFRTPVFYGALFVVVVGVLLVWAARRESKTEKLIKQRLAELKASGEPITTDDLANRFPDPTPANDALPIYAAAFAIATNNRVPTATPIVAGNFFPARQPIDANVMTQLIAFCEVTAAIATALPTNVPADATFPMHWSLGFTNRKTGIGVNFLAARSLSHTISAHAFAAAERGDSEAAAQFIVQGFRFNLRCRTPAGWCNT